MASAVRCGFWNRWLKCKTDLRGGRGFVKQKGRLTILRQAAPFHFANRHEVGDLAKTKALRRSGPPLRRSNCFWNRRTLKRVWRVCTAASHPCAQLTTARRNIPNTSAALGFGTRLRSSSSDTSSGWCRRLSMIQ